MILEDEPRWIGHTQARRRGVVALRAIYRARSVPPRSAWAWLPMSRQMRTTGDCTHFMARGCEFLPCNRRSPRCLDAVLHHRSSFIPRGSKRLRVFVSISSLGERNPSVFRDNTPMDELASDTGVG